MERKLERIKHKIDAAVLAVLAKDKLAPAPGSGIKVESLFRRPGGVAVTANYAAPPTPKPCSTTAASRPHGPKPTPRSQR
jgi:hypothetical protein